MGRPCGWTGREANVLKAKELVERSRYRVEQLHELQESGLVAKTGEFYPSVHYPPITMYSPIEADEFLDTFTLAPDGLMSVYVHIPFCDTRCVFCHYPVAVGLSEDKKDRYMRYLNKEMDLWLDRLGVDRIKAMSVLIAGGTPTAMSPARFARFHEDFVKRVDLGPCTQLAYDVHPRTLLGPDGTERLRIMRDHGSERLTIGVQSFDDVLLKKMNRGHTGQEALDSIKACHDAGYKDVCVEFIYGYPGQTMESWIRDMRLAIDSGVEEIQVYRLKVIPYGDEAGPILRMSSNTKAQFCSLEETLLMKEVANQMFAEAGMKQTLTRVFARDPDNLSHYARDQCCTLADQVGFGLSAFSSLRDRFSINPDSMTEYCDRLDRGLIPVNRGLVRSLDENRRWNVILPLKNWKVYKSNFVEHTGADLIETFGHQIDELKEFGLVTEDVRKIILTDKGRFFADEICQQFHTESYIPFKRDEYAEGPLNPYRGRTAT